jgi:hypothetical protein
MYACIGTHPDIAYAITWLAQFSFNPSEEHLRHARNILQYLCRTLHYQICYDSSSGMPHLHGFLDSDYAENRDDCHFTSAYIFLLCNGAVFWISQKQMVVSQSMAEAEYILMAEASK